MDRISPISSITQATIVDRMLETWRMSFTSRYYREMLNRIEGQQEHNSPAIRVSPAVKIEISAEARNQLEQSCYKS